jgi:hypothetical protein
MSFFMTASLYVATGAALDAEAVAADGPSV